MIKSLAFSAFFSCFVCSCATITITNDRGQKGKASSSRSVERHSFTTMAHQPFFTFMVGDPVVAKKNCPSGKWQKIELSDPFYGWIVTAFTLSAFQPVRVEMTCADKDKDS